MLSGVDGTYYRVDGGDDTTYTGTFDVSGDGTHTVEYWSVDTVGNIESTNSEDLHIDDTAPVSSSDIDPAWQTGPVAGHPRRR